MFISPAFSLVDRIQEKCEDHRASNGTEPRSIYGKIVAEADRLIDTDTVIRRTLQYGLSQYPGMPAEWHIDRAIDHLCDKYGENGYLKLWIPWSDNADRLSGLRRLLADPDNARAAVTDAYFRLTLRQCDILKFCRIGKQRRNVRIRKPGYSATYPCHIEI